MCWQDYQIVWHRKCQRSQRYKSADIARAFKLLESGISVHWPNNRLHWCKVVIASLISFRGLLLSTCFLYLCFSKVAVINALTKETIKIKIDKLPKHGHLQWSFCWNNIYFLLFQVKKKLQKKYRCTLRVFLVEGDEARKLFVWFFKGLFCKNRLVVVILLCL